MDVILKLTQLAERLRAQGYTCRAEGVEEAIEALGGDREDVMSILPEDQRKETNNSI